MKKILVMIILAVLIFTGCSRADSTSEVKPVSESRDSNAASEVDSTVDITLTFTTNADGIVYAAWVEDADGNLIAPLFACDSLMKLRGGRFNGTGFLTGDPLPYFKTKNGWKPGDSGWEYLKEIYSVDGVTGASPDSGADVKKSRTVELGNAAAFRVCLDVDNSVNTNEYFQDRPAFTYKSELIDSTASPAEYELALDGWMGNDTTGNPWGQDPRKAVEDYKTYKYMQGEKYLPYIIDNDGDYNNLVSSVTAEVK